MLQALLLQLDPRLVKNSIPGDEVLCLLHFAQSGRSTEYTIVDELLLAKKSRRWYFKQAAAWAWPLVATTAWRALVVRGGIKKGTVGVQMAKVLGAYAVGVCSTNDLQLVKDLDASEVIDYKTTDGTEKYINQDFDIVFDTVGSADEMATFR
ncbi:hypothetical protein BGX26_006619 [Mortierella sp. AD094]|nr:hypothetical protein BGX26_006619 [Mortierella sp. AD094]